MCGIAGYWSNSAREQAETLHRTGERMAAVMHHRGPDDSGVFEDASLGLTLAFSRLAIIDLSEAGHQPMSSACGRYVLVFNGEIYNFRILRAELERHLSFHGHSDTEVILGGFTIWGIRATVDKLNGMFAFAVWDRMTRTLILGRDRFGEKPLYYGRLGGKFLFGSELKALRAVAGFQASIDRGALSLFMRHGYIPAPYTIYHGISKLEPGSLLEVRGSVPAEPVRYWSAMAHAEQGASAPLSGSEEHLEEQVHELLYDAVGLRMNADVPLGAFLSGGIDSSLVLALMQAQSTRAVKSFSIGFSDSQYNEAKYAKQVSSHLGSEHTELYVSARDALEVIPKLPKIYDEPFADSSQIPTYLVSDLARRSVTVSLSGDGGDELFGGYSRYAALANIWSRLQKTPLSARKLGAFMMSAIAQERWDIVFKVAGPLLPSKFRVSRPGEKLHKLASALECNSTDEVYIQLVSIWSDPSRVVLNGYEPFTPLTGRLQSSITDPGLRAMQLDTVTYLPDDILTKVDRAAMAVSLETRVPLLDHRLYELAWRLPLSLRNRPGAGKFVLRKILERYIPRSLFDRPKMGFGVPIGNWLRGPLRDWGEDLLATPALRSQGLLDVDVVRDAWHEHISGRADHAAKLWNVLMLQAWLEEQSSG